MSKYRIKFFSDVCTSTTGKTELERAFFLNFNKNYGPDKEIYIVTGDDFTHVMIMNCGMPVLPPGFPKENVIGYAHEPLSFLNLSNAFVNYARENISKYFIGELHPALIFTGSPFIQDYGYLWHTVNPPMPVLPRNKIMSVAISKKNFAPGHKYRHQLVQRILKTELPIDIYGRGTAFYDKLGDPRIKGEFKSVEPYDGYKFHICIENFQTPKYISEKLTNCLLMGTTPIYWGATEVESVYPGCTIRLTGDLEADFRLLMDIFENPAKYQISIPDDVVRKTYNLFEHLDELYS